MTTSKSVGAQVQATDKTDTAKEVVAATIIGAIGSIPVVGSLVAELVGTLIPNWRLQRLHDFTQKLGERIEKLEERKVQEHLTDPGFAELLEEALRQVSTVHSDERRSRIADLISKGISEDSMKVEDRHHLLRILGQLNDVELVWLRSYIPTPFGHDSEFREKHANILNKPPATLGSRPEELDANAMDSAYKQHLAQLGLLTRESDSLISEMFSITRAGQLLLREVGLIDGIDFD